MLGLGKQVQVIGGGRGGHGRWRRGGGEGGPGGTGGASQLYAVDSSGNPP